MGKTLYITDLDGTLLNSQAELSEYTKNTINRLVEQGMYFTFATARTIYSAEPITRGLLLSVPCILNNGASIYDAESGKYIKNNCIPADTARKILGVFRENEVRCFVFKFMDERLVTCYDRVTDDFMQNYIEERKNGFNQPFIHCEDVAELLDGRDIYINSVGDYEKLLPVRNAVMEMADADLAFYRDTYTDKWFLEIFSVNASKANGLKYLRAQYGFEKIVAFGDNLNDLSMFREADVKIAVENARDELKQQADFIIRSNDEDGVAHYILNSLN